VILLACNTATGNKWVEQQGPSMVHSARLQLIGQRTQLVNAAQNH
jgi:hypothetical protein